MDDPGLRELSGEDLGALERLAGAHQLQARHAWGRLRVLIREEQQRRMGKTQVGLPLEGTRLKACSEFEVPAAAMNSTESERAFTSIESARKELREAALQHTAGGAQARALCRVLERLAREQAPQQSGKEADADAR